MTTEGEDYLEAEAPGYGAPLDGAAVGGESVGEGEEGDESEKSGVTSQGVLRREIGFECYGECTG